MKYIYFGSGNYSCYILSALLAAGKQPECVVSCRSKPKGRGLRIQDTPITCYAREQGLVLITLDSLREEGVYAALKAYAADIFVTADYGKILPSLILTLPKKIAVCVHPSLLPLYRGCAPLNWQLINNEKETGVTVFVMDEHTDTGAVIGQEKTTIEDSDDYFSLREKLGFLGGRLILREFEKIENDRYVTITQDDSCATQAPKLKKETGRIFWNESARCIHNLVRGIIDWPSAWAAYKGKPLKILQTQIIDQDAVKTAPATVVAVTKFGIDIACGKGILRILKIKPQAKSEMDAWSFANGYRVRIGDVFDL